MKLETLAAAIIATALSAPIFAQDKPASEAPTTAKTRPHSHLEDRQGIKPSQQPDKVKQTAATDRSRHYHPRDR